MSLEATTGDNAARLDLLTSPLFLVSTATLVVNDFVLKRFLAGAATGKLSDFAGLFAFTLFWCALFPSHRRIVLVAVTAAFTLWKLPVSQPALDAWNANAPFRLGRTVDLTDLFALPVIPCAVRYARAATRTPRPRVLTLSIIAAASLAFVATSYRTTFEYTSTYSYDGTPAELIAELERRGIVVVAERAHPDAPETPRYTLQVPATLCLDSIDATIIITARERATYVRLIKLTHRCPERRDDKARLYAVFRASVVEPLNLKKAA